jgi:pimeloyl-ACP methyl ester carboxylesterase
MGASKCLLLKQSTRPNVAHPAGSKLRHGPRDAPAIIMLHGFGASLHTWEEWSALLEPNYRVIRMDLPGFGLTGADPTGDYTDARSIALLLALLDRLGVQRATFIGSSMGGASPGPSLPRIQTAWRSWCWSRRTASRVPALNTASRKRCQR